MKGPNPIETLPNILSFVLVFISLFLVNEINAQICGTKTVSSEVHDYTKANTEYTIKLVVWLVGNDDGEGYLEHHKVFDMFSHSFPLFEEHGIFFEVCSSKYINSTRLLDNPNQLIFDVSNPEFYLNGFINYYLINSEASAYSGGAAGRKGSSTRAWGYFDEDLPSFIFSHELGHILSLNHTFSYDDCFSDCEIEGDLVCDTPPDPYKVQADQSPSTVGYSYSAPCDFRNIANLRTSCGELYTDIGFDVPYGQNMMSYYLGYDCPDLKRFTDGQGERMRSHIANNPSIILVEDDPVLLKECVSTRSVVWEDINANGIQDQFESGIPNIKVQLVEYSNRSNIIQETTTDSEGYYDFANVQKGSYQINFEIPNNKIPTFSDFGIEDLDSDINANAQTAEIKYENPGDLNVDAGFVSPSRIGNKVWIDEPTGLADILDPADTPFPNIKVMLFNGISGELLEEVYTDDDGNYVFSVLPGSYKLGIQAPSSYRAVQMNAGFDSVDSDFDPMTNRTVSFEIGIDKVNLNIDAGFRFDVSLAIASQDFNVIYDPLSHSTEISWQNGHTKDIESFEVEKSYLHTGNFEKVCEIVPEDQSYAYGCEDDQLFETGTYYYRLKENYTGGAIEYSSIKTINVETEKSIRLYPNPTNGEYIQLELRGFEQAVSLTIIDRKGQICIQSFDHSEEQLMIPISALSPGIYFVKVDSKMSVYHLKFIKT